MEDYVVEEIEVSDELAAEFEKSELPKCNLIKIAEQMGYTRDQAVHLINNTQATLINKITGFRLYEVFKAGNLDLLPGALRFVKLEVLYIDDCQLIFLKLPETPSLSEENINLLRQGLGRYYPEKLQSYTLTLTSPDGKQLQLSVYNLMLARQFDQFIEHYSRWFDEQSRWVGPKFDCIKRGIGKWMENKLDGTRPQQDEFINWFVTNRLRTLTLNLSFTFDQTTGYIVPGSVVPVRLTVKNLAEYFTPDVIEQDFIEFGLWKKEQVEETLANVLSKKALKCQAPPATSIPKRVNSEAKEKHARLLAQYDQYMKDGFIHGSAVDKLVHDFKYEYERAAPANRKKNIQKIIRERNNKE